MKTKKMTVRVPEELLEQAKQYAREHDTTLTRLITAYLGQIATESDPLAGATIVKRLAGSLSQDVTIEDHRRYMEDKYGRSP